MTHKSSSGIIRTARNLFPAIGSLNAHKNNHGGKNQVQSQYCEFFHAKKNKAHHEKTCKSRPDFLTLQSGTRSVHTAPRPTFMTRILITIRGQHSPQGLVRSKVVSFHKHFGLFSVATAYFCQHF